MRLISFDTSSPAATRDQNGSSSTREFACRSSAMNGVKPPEPIGLRVDLDRGVAAARDEERRGHAGVRTRVALRVDPLQRSDRDTLLVQAEVRPEHQRVALDGERGEVRLVHDDEDVHRQQEQPDDDHHRIAAARAEHEDGERGQRKERERRPEQREVGTDRASCDESRCAQTRLDRKAPLDLVEGGADARIRIVRIVGETRDDRSRGGAADHRVSRAAHSRDRRSGSRCGTRAPRRGSSCGTRRPAARHRYRARGSGAHRR